MNMNIHHVKRVETDEITRLTKMGTYIRHLRIRTERGDLDITLFSEYQDNLKIRGVK